MPNTVKSVNRIQIYEQDNREVATSDTKELIVESHWNRTGMVIISFEGRSVTVCVHDLVKALTNATNV